MAGLLVAFSVLPKVLHCLEIDFWLYLSKLDSSAVKLDISASLNEYFMARLIKLIIVLSLAFF